MKLALAVAGAIVLAGTLTACGGNDGGAKGGSGGSGSGYCEDLKSASKDFRSLSSGDITGFGTVVTTVHKLSDEAPGDVKDDWKTLDVAVTRIETAFKDAGLKFSDLADIEAGKLPKNVDMSKLAGLSTTLSDVSSEKYTTASKNIEKHAKDVCKVDLNAS
jgi:hypothetical protein